MLNHFVGPLEADFVRSLLHDGPEVVEVLGQRGRAHILVLEVTIE